ncbi:type I pullulanase [Neobacillus niacini]|uniref:type I pullulanase n=1 Tax=Neobacillus niacini TaxID=86668 RepID=UPI00203C766C|nr:type I pullulanase [Neobacillus niacini]MCM3692057.1 type I pullulanase [Neobacillus niacini]
MNSNDRNFQAYLDEMDIITILLPLTYHHGLSSTFSILDETQKVLTLQIIKKQQIENYNKYICRLAEEISFGHPYWIIDEHGGKTDLQIGAVIRTARFDDRFFYDGNDLGVRFVEGQTQFKLWSPTAAQVKLKLRQPNSTFSEIIKMRREEKGVWSVLVHSDLELYQYTFLVLVNQEWRESVDPYAASVTANGELGVVVNLEKTRRQKPYLPPFENPVDAIIYETHIRDFTIHPDSGVKHKGLYLGAGELNTKGKDGEPTGISYVKDLGVTHIEFLPFNDFAGVDETEPNKEYNWGYNPLHFNVPEGSYSSNPSDPYARIIELKQLIDNIHSQGIRVIMDVVYNHVFIRETSSFEKVVPGYYFRHNELGFPSNGTGVGNDIASERKMVRKFILDSIRFWMEEYHIDGFRFDLMGILDIDTMKEVRKTCDSIQEGALIIGEGWNLNTPLPIDKKAILRNQSKLPSIAQFNDKFRDTIKGNTFYLYDKGYVLGNEHYYEDAKEVLAGSVGIDKEESWLLANPSQSVNYVECHDNHTLWDKLLSCLPDMDELLHIKYHRLATGLVILSQGIPFLHSGQEFFRTKRGDGNSYKSPDHINRLDWNRKQLYSDNVKYIKGLIQIRKQFPCFRLKTGDAIRNYIQVLPLPIPLVGYRIQNKNHDFREVLLLINPLRSKQTIQIPDGRWSVLADEKKVEISTKQVVSGKEMVLEPVCLTILAKK